jgi:hypothetical protein
MRNVLVEEAPLPGGAVRAVDWNGVEAAAGLGVVKGRVAAEGAMVFAMGTVVAQRTGSGYTYGALGRRVAFVRP